MQGGGKERSSTLREKSQRKQERMDKQLKTDMSNMKPTSSKRSTARPSSVYSVTESKQKEKDFIASTYHAVVATALKSGELASAGSKLKKLALEKFPMIYNEYATHVMGAPEMKDLTSEERFMIMKKSVALANDELRRMSTIPEEDELISLLRGTAIGHLRSSPELPMKPVNPGPTASKEQRATYRKMKQDYDKKMAQHFKEKHRAAKAATLPQPTPLVNLPTLAAADAMDIRHVDHGRTTMNTLESLMSGLSTYDKRGGKNKNKNKK